MILQLCQKIKCNLRECCMNECLLGNHAEADKISSLKERRREDKEKLLTPFGHLFNNHQFCDKNGVIP